ncbi:DUF1428 domain-containing protein [Aliikangiella marina]|uniref:DUF1428 domain-containing protein n=1 Tax=Aliikangiella marina TaxID=1712262 RepID=A0A545TE32_9GAMM|nr:DUF1428 domain-containing protein [Aliikangiella marina]TQV75483.1 DUF1428 domain-containing protein [Aliikangiella marina]
MKYVDGYLVPVSNANKEAYFEMAKIAAPIFKENGAISVVETWGDDVPDGEVTSFPMSVKLNPDETVVFSWIVWPSKEVRDIGMKNAMQDERFKPFEKAMPFDGKRMIFGGFNMLLEE